MSDKINTWLEKAKTELKVEDLSSKAYRYQGIDYDSFSFEKNQKQISLPNRSEGNDWKIGLRISNPTDNIVPYLMDGAESLWVDTDKIESLEAVFDKVDFAHVDADIHSVSPISLEPQNISHFDENYYSEKKATLKLIESSTNFFDSTTEQLQKLGTLISEGKKVKLVHFHLYLDKHLLFNTAKIRAVEILLQNFKEALDANFQINISAEINPNVLESENFEQNLIVCTSAATSAVMAGIDKLFLSPKSASQKSLQELHRLSFNIQHILKHESKIDEVSDPLKGSFFIEDLTEKIVNKLWQNLNDL